MDNGVLLEAGLLEETQYLHVKASVLGMRFVAELPLMEVPTANSIENNTIIDKKEDSESEPHFETDNSLFENLKIAARNPFADGKASGVAFEEAIATVFDFMGFESKRIGGSGNTDVIVRWKDNDGKIISAIIDGKSKSNGAVTHGDISDVAIETHKEKNNAEYVAIGI